MKWNDKDRRLETTERSPASTEFTGESEVCGYVHPMDMSMQERWLYIRPQQSRTKSLEQDSGEGFR